MILLLGAVDNALEAFEWLLLNVTALTTTAWVLQKDAPLAVMANALEALERLLLYVTFYATAVSYKLGFYKMMLILAAMANA